MAETVSVFNKEALITTHVPSASCYSSGWIGTAGAYSFGTYTTSVNYYAAPGCYPYHTGISHLFSPGICPGGWTTALMTVKGATTAQCCPTGYDKYSGDGAGAYCRSVRTESMSVDCVYPTSTGRSSLSCVPSFIGPGAAVIFAYTIAYDSSDLSRFPSGYTPGTIGDAGGTPLPALKAHTPGITINVSTPTSSPAPGASGRSTPGQTSPTGDPGTVILNPSELTTGAKAGIGVGVAIGVLLLLGALVFCLQKRRRNKNKTVQGDTKMNRDDEKEVVGDNHRMEYSKGAGIGSQELELDGRETGLAKTELDGAATRRIVEADTHGNTGAELPGQQEQRWQELPSERETTSAVSQPEATQQTTVSKPHPSSDEMSATTLGPVSMAWDGSHQSGHVNASESQTMAAAAVAPSNQTVEHHPETIEEIELRYLENEERRIRERKEALLANRRQ